MCPLSVRQVFSVESLSCNLAFRVAGREGTPAVFGPTLLYFFPSSFHLPILFLLCHQISFIHMSLCLYMFCLDFPLFFYRNRIRTPILSFFRVRIVQIQNFFIPSSGPLLKNDSATCRYYLIPGNTFKPPLYVLNRIENLRNIFVNKSVLLQLTLGSGSGQFFISRLGSEKFFMELYGTHRSRYRYIFYPSA
jgi:hypothetical protein